MRTRIIPVPRGEPLGDFVPGEGLERLESWRIRPEAQRAVEALEPAARLLRTSDTPVAFPTETVYGLGADATRSDSVKGIYSAKGRPSDNPLIVHVSDLEMLRGLLGPGGELPARYRPLLERFWPGPLTILLPLPRPSPLAPEVTAGLGTFGVRMPSSPLALTLIKLAGVPLAAPSANASTKPSPTLAQHVMDDLDGRVELILDGGPCRVGVESTVVDGLCDPPVVLRPGGVGIQDLRRCPGWESVVKAYKDRSEEGKAAPRAPGMKYKHYSPKAKVVLYEASDSKARDGILLSDVGIAPASPTNGNATYTNGHGSRTIGIIRTKRWKQGAGLDCGSLDPASSNMNGGDSSADRGQHERPYPLLVGDLKDESGERIGRIYDLDLGLDTTSIAQGLFAALRELDLRGADTIFVEGIDGEHDVAAAVMNRLRKAASEIRA
ncbi:hypothetical protein HIM_02157 [Hirsutella minnesotensis 3608]|nr:hypothetical protein HIM_02157 [Hirsutella minnesotensis 3608]